MTIEITGTAQEEAWRSRTTPPVERVRPTVWSIPVDCADLHIRYTFAYAVIGDDGRFVLIDPGLKTPKGDAQLGAGLEAAGLSLDRLDGVLVTHFHMDHIGGAPSLTEGTTAWFGMHALELEAFPRWPDPQGVYDRFDGMLDVWGVPRDVAPGAARPGRLDPDEYLPVAPASMPDRLLSHRERLGLAGRDLEVLWTPGHTAGHLCVVDHDEQVVFTGDHVLPRITPNVSTYTHDLASDPVAEYNGSLELLAGYDDYEALPAHEYRFRGLRERASELLEHMHERSHEVVEVSRRGYSTAWDIAQRLTWRRGWESLDGSNLRAALGETHAHMNHVRVQGQRAG